MKMSSPSIEVGTNRIFRVTVDNAVKEAVSNFSIEVLRSVHVSADAGGSGILLKLTRYPDDVKK